MFKDASTKAINKLPPSLKSLSLDTNCLSPLNNLPRGLRKLKACVNEYSGFEALPCMNLEELEIEVTPKTRTLLKPPPASVTRLVMKGYYFGPAPFAKQSLLTFLNASELRPQGGTMAEFWNALTEKGMGMQLTTIYLPPFFDEPLGDLPESLEFISIGSGYRNPPLHLPPNVKHLEFRDNSSFNQVLSSQNLPPKLLSLSFMGTSFFNKPLVDLPLTLTALRFEDGLTEDLMAKSYSGAHYTHVIILHANIRVLKVGPRCPIGDCHIPEGLHILEVRKGTKKLPELPKGCEPFFC
jgi:FNIP Repeat